MSALGPLLGPGCDRSVSGCRACDEDHSALNALLLYCECTVVPGGAFHVALPRLGAAELAALFTLQARALRSLWRSKRLRAAREGREIPPLHHPSWMYQGLVTARRAGDGISRLHPRRISAFEFQAK
jgi:hypothetical protein